MLHVPRVNIDSHREVRQRTWTPSGHANSPVYDHRWVTNGDFSENHHVVRSPEIEHYKQLSKLWV